jgi:hypothetical protein
MLEPLSGRYRDHRRAPEFGVLVAQDGRTLPRCEQFAYRQIPTIRPFPGTRFVDRPQVMNWLQALAADHGYGTSHRHAVFGVLHCLNVAGGRPVHKQNLQKLTDWILDHWDQIGGDPVIPTLLDVALSESDARASDVLLHLVNPVTGQEETWMPCKFRYAAGLEPFPSWKSWPGDWPRPWETATEE